MHGTQAQIRFILEPSSFWGIFLWSYSSSHSVPWWEGPLGLLGELLQIWHLFETSRDSIGLFRYYSTHCHSQSGMGISIWDIRKLSHRAHIGVLLQYAWFQYLYTSICYASSRYTYCSHSRYYFQDTTHFVGFAPWLPRLSMSEDCVQRRTSVSFLWDTFFMGWELKYLILKLCKRFEVPKHGDDFCSPSFVSL